MLIEHEMRCWQAEVDNAQRIVNRMRMMGGLTALVLGLGFFKFSWFIGQSDVSVVRSDLAVWLIKIVLAAALVCLARSFWMVTRRNRRRPAMNASWHMFLAGSELSALPTNVDGIAVMIVDHVDRASLSLLRRNARLDERLRWAMRSFYLGIAGVLLATLLFFSAARHL